MSSPVFVPKDPGCVFCKIAAGEIPSFKVFEDDTLIAFLDISPVVEGHTLIVPKAHYANVMETPPEVLAAISARVPMISRAVLEATGLKACHLLVNSGAEAMQSVPHLHFHIMPRHAGDRFGIPWHTKLLSPAEGADLVAKVKAGLPSQS